MPCLIYVVGTWRLYHADCTWLSACSTLYGRCLWAFTCSQGSEISGNFLPVVFGKHEDSDSLADPTEWIEWSQILHVTGRKKKHASQQSATHQVLASLNYWYNGHRVNRNGSKYSKKNSVAFRELKKLCLNYTMDSFSGWPSLLSWARDGWFTEVIGPNPNCLTTCYDHILGVSCMKPRWALFRILRSFNQPGMDNILSSSKVNIFRFPWL